MFGLFYVLKLAKTTNDSNVILLQSWSVLLSLKTLIYINLSVDLDG
jgi:hypothetical protein